MNEIIKGCGFHHIAYRTANWDEAVLFWCNGLGCVIKLQWGEAPQRAAMLDLGDGNYFELFEREPTHNENTEERESSALHLCLRTDNCEDAVKVAVAAGAQVTVAPSDVDFKGQIIPAAKIAFIKAPDGIIVEFFQCDAL